MGVAEKLEKAPLRVRFVTPPRDGKYDVNVDVAGVGVRRIVRLGVPVVTRGVLVWVAVVCCCCCCVWFVIVGDVDGNNDEILVVALTNEVDEEAKLPTRVDRIGGPLCCGIVKGVSGVSGGGCGGCGGCNIGGVGVVDEVTVVGVVFFFLSLRFSRSCLRL